MVAPTAPSPPSEPIAQAIESSTPFNPPLPRLSPTDHALLTRLLALNEDYPALAAQLAISQDAGAEAPRSPGSPPSSPLMPCAPSLVPDLLSLLVWSAQPHITAWLGFYHHLQDQHSRRLAITELQSLLKTSDNPIEKRRTATTLLRALDHKWPAIHHRVQSRDALGPPSPRYKRGEVSRGSASDGEGGCSLSRKPPTTATPALKSEISNFQLPSPPPPRPFASSAFSSPPPPSITPSPSPSHTPTDLARAIATDLSTGNLLQTAATLAAISTDSLRAGADTVIERLEPHLGLPDPAHISPLAYHKPAPPYRHACKVTISNGPHTLTLGFTKPHNAPWLLNSLDTT